MSTAIQQHVGHLIKAAKLSVDLGGYAPEEALILAAKLAVQDAHRARTRDGYWAYETSSEALEDAVFAGSVASDVLDGTVTRPSTGNVREYALAQLAGL